MPNIKPKSVQTDYEKVLLPQGTYVAYLTGAVDLGSQITEDKKTKAKRQVRQLRLTFTTTHEGKEARINKIVGLSLSDMAILPKIIKALGVTFEGGFLDLNKLVGKPCFIQVDAYLAKDGKTYNSFNGVSQLMIGMEVEEYKGDTLVFDLDNFSDSKFETLPDWLKEIIQKSPEYTQLTLQHDANLDTKNDLPF